MGISGWKSAGVFQCGRVIMALVFVIFGKAFDGVQIALLRESFLDAAGLGPLFASTVQTRQLQQSVFAQLIGTLPQQIQGQLLVIAGEVSPCDGVGVGAPVQRICMGGTQCGQQCSEGNQIPMVVFGYTRQAGRVAAMDQCEPGLGGFGAG